MPKRNEFEVVSQYSPKSFEFNFDISLSRMREKEKRMTNESHWKWYHKYIVCDGTYTEEMDLSIFNSTLFQILNHLKYFLLKGLRKMCLHCGSKFRLLALNKRYIVELQIELMPVIEIHYRGHIVAAHAYAYIFPIRTQMNNVYQSYYIFIDGAVHWISYHSFQNFEGFFVEKKTVTVTWNYIEWFFFKSSFWRTYCTAYCS